MLPAPSPVVIRHFCPAPPGLICVVCANPVRLGSVAAARAKGLCRREGKEFVVKDGDVMPFKVNVQGLTAPAG
jgi:ribosome-binding ATPase YchF (GTP1/OBG family)